ncbi:MAG: amidase domain-containing protein [Clostridia bacterium]|nr:amidase domain-containing protein [Clostridia bacterium]
MRKSGYNRIKAVEYAAKWTYSRNPKYYNFDGLGGDCTNFISQAIFAGCGVMNYTPIWGWYYIDIKNRAPSWTAVKYLYEFLTKNGNEGPYACPAKKSELEIADLVQLKRGRHFTHSLIITKIEGDRLFIASHSYDSFDNPLSNYIYDDIRYLHILGSRKI